MTPLQVSPAPSVLTPSVHRLDEHGRKATFIIGQFGAVIPAPSCNKTFLSNPKASPLPVACGLEVSCVPALKVAGD